LNRLPWLLIFPSHLLSLTVTNNENIMNRIFKTAFLFASLTIVSCGNAQNKGRLDGPQVLIKTEFGDIKLVLYNETPKHRDNFLKLAKVVFYDGTLFHRVIKEFMIQGGDPNTKNAQPGQKLGNGGPGYTIDPEINPKFLHKRGALAAARLGDNVNPEKKSSGSQFYIVQGQVIPPSQVPALVENENTQLPQKIMNQLALAKRDSFMLFQKNNDKPGFDKLVERIKQEAMVKAAQNPYKLTDEQYHLYTTIGGVPSLDGEYTVFGEVIDGMAVVDSIAAQQTGANDRPVKDIKMEVKVIKE
jgi:cyclophilin family peptidyl-prolyl cis-trans isomerase